MKKLTQNWKKNNNKTNELKHQKKKKKKKRKEKRKEKQQVSTKYPLKYERQENSTTYFSYYSTIKNNTEMDIWPNRLLPEEKWPRNN